MTEFGRLCLYLIFELNTCLNSIQCFDSRPVILYQGRMVLPPLPFDL